MITRVSTTTENYDPRRKGRRVVTIDKEHQELIGGYVTPASNTQSDGAYNYTEIVGGEAFDDFVDAIRRFFCRVTGWCDSAAPKAPPVPAARARVVQMLPEDSGEAPGPSHAPEFDDVTGQTQDAGPGLPASSAPEDYGAPSGTLPPRAIADATNQKPPPLPASSIPVMTSVLNRVQQGDPAAIKGLASLAQSAPFNPVSAQTLKNLAALSAALPASSMSLKPVAAASTFQAVTPVSLIPLPSTSKPILLKPMVAGGEVTHAVTQIFRLVLSPLAWTLDGTGRLTAIAGQKLEHLSRLL